MNTKTIAIGITLLVLSLLSAITSQVTETIILVEETTISRPIRETLVELFNIDISRTYTRAILKIENNGETPVKIAVVGRDVQEKTIGPSSSGLFNVGSIIDLLIVEIQNKGESATQLSIKAVIELTEIKRPYSYLAIPSLILFIAGNIVIALGIIGASIERYRQVEEAQE